MRCAVVIITALSLLACDKPDDQLDGRTLADRYGVGAAMRQQSIDDDVVLLRRARAAAAASSARAFVKALGSDDKLWSLGFDVHRYVRKLDAGFVTCRVALLALRDEVAERSISCYATAADFKELAPVYRSAAGDLAFIEGGRHDGTWSKYRSTVFIEHARSDGTIRSRIERTLAQQLGARSQVRATGAVGKAHRRLTAADQHNEIGFHCDAGMVPSRAAMDMQTLVDHKRADLLRDALRSPNAEGRIYGAIGLSRLGALDEADRQSIAVLKKQRLMVNICDKPGLLDHARYLQDLR